MTEAWAVVPAGGSGSRFAAGQEASDNPDKLLALLDGVPVLVRTLQRLLQAPSIKGIVLVTGEHTAAAYRETVLDRMPQAPVQFARGGTTRRESVYNGLLAVPESVPVVAIHDAARPLVCPRQVERAIQAVLAGQIGAVLAVPIHDTVKEAWSGTPAIKQTLDRGVLWRAQTPQAFRRDDILRAHRELPPSMPVTDDAQLMELAGQGPVALIPGDDANLKITVALDLMMAETLLRAGFPGRF